MWIVMTSRAKMPGSCWGTYRRVALVQLDQRHTANGWRPAMISTRARGVRRVIDMGHHSVGKTARCSYQRALTEARDRAQRLNNLAPVAQMNEIMTWGGSA